MSTSQTLVLEEGDETKKANGEVPKKGERSEAKSAAALKSHSEAEKRRRERINAHLTTLRGLVPSNEKMDKAALLAEVIDQVKQLKKNAAEVSDSFFIPLDSDELRVEQIDENIEEDGMLYFRAFICCGYRPGLLSDLRQAMETLQLNLVKSEISTLGDRVKNVFFFTSGKRDMPNGVQSQELLVTSVHQALSCILDKAAASADLYSRSLSFPSKRQRLSYFESSCSSS